MSDTRLGHAFASRHSLTALGGAALLALAACGGGGDGGGTPSGGTAQGSLVITAANAKPVAADALDSATNIAAARSASAFVVGATIQPGAAPGASATLRLAQAALTLADQGRSAAGLALSAAVNRTVSCSLGGTLTVAGNVANSNSFTVGDSVTLTAAGCRETIDGVVTSMSGSVTLAITGGSFDSAAPFPHHVVMTLNASNFGVAAGPETSVATGDMTLDLTAPNGDSTSVLLTGSALSNQVTSSAGTRSFTMRGYRQALAIANNVTAYTVSGDFESSNGRLGSGTVSYHLSTPTALAVTNTGDFTAGQLRIDGNGSALVLTVGATNSFQLAVDTNGDGAAEANASATLADLRALL